MLVVGFKEAGDDKTGYSKFAKPEEKTGPQIGSKLGMFIIYMPAALLGLYLGVTNSGTERYGLFNTWCTLLPLFPPPPFFCHIFPVCSALTHFIRSIFGWSSWHLQNHHYVPLHNQQTALLRTSSSG
jgi:hypothetical protein